jgi:hypothetical protein
VIPFTVEGYLVLGSRGCTLKGCPDEHPNCNVCELTVRLAASRNEVRRSLRLSDARDSYSCLSTTPEQCVFDARGQHVLARGAIRVEDSIEPVDMLDPQICTLGP